MGNTPSTAKRYNLPISRQSQRFPMWTATVARAKLHLGECVTVREQYEECGPRPAMSEKIKIDKLLHKASPASLKGKALLTYTRTLDVIVGVLVFIMVLTLIGALAGLVIDFFAAAHSFGSAMSAPRLAQGIVDTIDRQLVIDVLSVFVLIELFRTFTDYLEYRRVRLRVLAEVGIAFVLREIFIGLYNHDLKSAEIIAFSVLLAVLVAARIASVKFGVSEDTGE